MWLHKSRSISKRNIKCNISFFDIGDETRYYSDIAIIGKEIKIDKEKLFENQGIDTNNAFNFKLLGTGCETNIFKLSLIDSKDNNLISIGLHKYQTNKDILCITKDNNTRYYLLLPYFNVDKLNLTEGKYLNGDTQLSYHLGLFEMQISIQEKDDNKTIKKLEILKLIDTIPLKNESSFNEFFNNYNEFWVSKDIFHYFTNGFSYNWNCFYKLPLTKTIYYFDITNINNPKIGNIKFSGDDFDDIYNGRLFFNKGRWFIQFQVDRNEYIVRDNYNGKYENLKILKQKEYYPKGLIYNKKTNPYFSHEKNDDLHFDRYNDILFYEVKDFEHLPFSKLKNRDNRYIRFQFTPFNNLNLAYYQYLDRKRDYLLDYLFEYCLLAKNKDIYIVTELNPKTITSKYILNSKYENKYHCYLYYLDDENRVPYIQVWKDNKTKQVYGIVLNMMGKRGVFDKKIIEERI